MISYGVSDTQNYIVTELLGQTLKDKLKEREGPFSIETVCLVGLQIVSSTTCTNYIIVIDRFN